MFYQNHFFSDLVGGKIYYGIMRNVTLTKRLSVGHRSRIIKVTLSGLGLAALVWFSTIFFMLGPQEPSKAAGPGSATLSVPAGSFIINMGVMPQTMNNALKPYGLVYQMLEQFKIPVWWAFNYTTKNTLGGTDFINDTTTYKSGVFIIPGSFITPAVSDSIQAWRNRGVIGSYNNVAFFTKVYTVLTSFPKVIIDNLSGNQSIIVGYFNNAGIPATTYRIGSPSSLTACDDIWVNPHGDPAWSTHGYLYNYMVNNNGNIWSQCHAVSMLENLVNPSNPAEKMNFLTTAGLKCWYNGTNGNTNANATTCGVNESHVSAPSTPFTNVSTFLKDPVMQYMDNMHSVCLSGSEGWFVPLSTSSWRSTTKQLVTVNNWSTPTSIGLSQQGVLAVYGSAYGDATKGLVMYQGGHDMSGSAAANIAGQRSFLNFCLLVGKRKELELTSANIQISGSYVAGMPAYLSVTPGGGTPPYSYQWSTTMQGSFSSTTTSSTVFTPAMLSTAQSGTISVQITDACNRIITQTLNVTSSGSALPIDLLGFNAIRNGREVELNWSTSVEKDNDYFTVQRSVNGSSFEDLGTVSGNGNSGQVHHYSFVDRGAPISSAYYRLSQTDYNGSTNVFSPVYVGAVKSETELHVFPNPISKKTVIVVQSAVKGSAELEIWSTTGVNLFSRKIEVGEGYNSILLEEAENLPTGRFILRLKIDDRPMTSTFLVKLF